MFNIILGFKGYFKSIITLLSKVKHYFAYSMYPVDSNLRQDDIG